MQLFISDAYNLDQNNIIIYDERIVHQCFHVLRYKPNQLLQLQDKWIRYTLCITNISKKEIITEITNTETSLPHSNTTTLSIALPNRFDKAELIVQKLTEIGIDHINFWKAERSILRDIPDKKLQRLQSIAIEASEQSFRRHLPTIAYLDNSIENHILENEYTIFFNRWWENNIWWEHTTSIHALIGPEWWFSPTELEKFKQKNIAVYSLWDTILRMETAAIIWSRLIKNL